jgi:hypothetical protein
MPSPLLDAPRPLLLERDVPAASRVTTSQECGAEAERFQAARLPDVIGVANRATCEALQCGANPASDMTHFYAEIRSALSAQGGISIGLLEVSADPRIVRQR